MNKSRDQIKDAKTTPFTSNIGDPQGHTYRGPKFELYFENALRKVKKKTGITNQKDFLQEMI